MAKYQLRHNVNIFDVKLNVDFFRLGTSLSFLQINHYVKSSYMAQCQSFSDYARCQILAHPHLLMKNSYTLSS